MNRTERRKLYPLSANAWGIIIGFRGEVVLHFIYSCVMIIQQFMLRFRATTIHPSFDLIHITIQISWFYYFGYHSDKQPFSVLITAELENMYTCSSFFAFIPVTGVLPRPLVKSAYQKLTFLFLIQNICCGYSKEPSQWDGSFEHPKHILKLMAKKIFTI